MRKQYSDLIDKLTPLSKTLGEIVCKVKGLAGSGVLMMSISLEKQKNEKEKKKHWLKDKRRTLVF